MDIQIVSDLSRAGVTRGGVNLFDFGAPGQLPDEGMLPGPTPNNQYSYLPHPLSPPLLHRRGGGNLTREASPLYDSLRVWRGKAPFTLVSLRVHPDEVGRRSNLIGRSISLAILCWQH
jgi:hypothetical protein